MAKGKKNKGTRRRHVIFIPGYVPPLTRSRAALLKTSEPESASSSDILPLRSLPASLEICASKKCSDNGASVLNSSNRSKCSPGTGIKSSTSSDSCSKKRSRVRSSSSDPEKRPRLDPQSTLASTKTTQTTKSLKHRRSANFAKTSRKIANGRRVSSSFRSARVRLPHSCKLKKSFKPQRPKSALAEKTRVSTSKTVSTGRPNGKSRPSNLSNKHNARVRNERKPYPNTRNLYSSKPYRSRSPLLPARSTQGKPFARIGLRSHFRCGYCGSRHHTEFRHFSRIPLRSRKQTEKVPPYLILPKMLSHKMEWREAPEVLNTGLEKRSDGRGNGSDLARLQEASYKKDLNSPQTLNQAQITTDTRNRSLSNQNMQNGFSSRENRQFPRSLGFRSASAISLGGKSRTQEASEDIPLTAEQRETEFQELLDNGCPEKQDNTRISMSSERKALAAGGDMSGGCEMRNTCQVFQLSVIRQPVPNTKIIAATLKSCENLKSTEQAVVADSSLVRSSSCSSFEKRVKRQDQESQTDLSLLGTNCVVSSTSAPNILHVNRKDVSNSQTKQTVPRVPGVSVPNGNPNNAGYSDDRSATMGGLQRTHCGASCIIGQDQKKNRMNSSKDVWGILSGLALKYCSLDGR